MNQRELPAHVKAYVARGNIASTVGSTITRVMPTGTNVASMGGDVDPWELVPEDPADVFAATGVLLETSGAFSFFGVGSGFPHADYPKLSIKPDDIADLEAVGRAWSDQPDFVPEVVAELWSELISYWKFPLIYRAYKFTEEQEENNQFWWKACWRLFIIADEAYSGVGFTPHNPSSGSLASRYWKMQKAKIPLKQRGGHREVKNVELPCSVASQCDPDIVCVQPKSLLPTVGAGTRVFSKYLALIRPRGLVRTQWAVNTQLPSPKLEMNLNVLVVPFPTKIEKGEIRVTERRNGRGSVNVFMPRQTWLEDKPFRDFMSNCSGLVRKIKEKSQNIHAIVLPEFALNKARFQEFADDIKQDIPELEFIISGTRQNCEIVPKNGNYIWIRKFVAGDTGFHTSQDDYFELSQSKHHRWKLDGRQIKDNSLQMDALGGLNELPHWEDFVGRPREMNFLAFRQQSAFCGVICEDLARSEPCHEIIRAVGPNLIFGLLMDGPQIEGRWSGKYASLFADDHGCAVMTVSSLGMVRKSQEGRSAKERSHAVVYFHSPYMPEGSKSFCCKFDDEGVFIRLEPRKSVEEETSRSRTLIDGRKKDVVDWIIAHGETIRVDK